MNSFALWGTGNNDVKELVEMHFNLWIEYSKGKRFSRINSKANIPFLDVGIKIPDIENIKEVYFYIPFEIGVDEISDLGYILNEPNIVNAVFNENYCVTSSSSKHIQVKNLEGSHLFGIYALDVSTDIKFESRYDGTNLKIDISKIKKGCTVQQVEGKNPYYIRFRIKTKKIEQLIRNTKPVNAIFQSAVSLDMFIDFRFNDKRTLCNSLVEEMNNSENMIHLRKVHFLLLMRSDIDLLSNGIVNERGLEKKIWAQYIGQEINDNMIAYHWKAQAKDNKSKEQQNDKMDTKKEEGILSSYLQYIKLRKSKCNWGTIIIYIVILGLLTIIFNTASSIIFERIKPVLIQKHWIPTESSYSKSIQTQGILDDN